MTDAETPALLPCPFCGDLIAADTSLEPDVFVTRCIRCGARGPARQPDTTLNESAFEALDAWNLRTPSPDDLRREGAEAERARVVATILDGARAFRYDAPANGWHTGYIRSVLVKLAAHIARGDHIPATEAGTGEEGKR